MFCLIRLIFDIYFLILRPQFHFDLMNSFITYHENSEHFYFFIYKIKHNLPKFKCKFNYFVVMFFYLILTLYQLYRWNSATCLCILVNEFLVVS